LDKLALAATREVQGVHDIEHLVVGALIGSIAGGALGFSQGGPAGAAIGASFGTAAGAFLGHLIEQSVDALHDTESDHPPLHVRISAEYGSNLYQVAEDVRRRVRETVYDLAGLRVGAIEIEIVEVVQPRAVRARIH